MPPRTTNNDCKLSANNGAKIAAGAAKMKNDQVSRCAETLCLLRLGCASPARIKLVFYLLAAFRTSPHNASSLTKKAEPPPTRDVNRDSGTASANGGWLRRLVRRIGHKSILRNHASVTRYGSPLPNGKVRGSQSWWSVLCNEYKQPCRLGNTNSLHRCPHNTPALLGA